MADGQISGGALPDDREEKLAQELAKDLPQPVAYLNAGYSAKDKNVAAAACSRLLRKRPAINARVAQLREVIRNDIKLEEFKGDIESLTRMLIEDRAFARECRQPGAAVSASAAIAKLYKLGGDNPVGSKDNPLVTVTKIELVPGEKSPA